MNRLPRSSGASFTRAPNLEPTSEVPQAQSRQCVWMVATDSKTHLNNHRANTSRSRLLEQRHGEAHDNGAAFSMSQKQRSETATRRQAPRTARTGLPRVIASDKPVAIAGCEVPCYVLDDETRVLSQRGFLEALGRRPTASTAALPPPKARGVRLPVFLAAKNLQPFIPKDLAAASTRIEFSRGTGRSMYGYNAKLLPQVCRVYLRARQEKRLFRSQEHIAERAESVLADIAEDGIVSLVDQAAGYDPARLALARTLEQYIARSLQPWVKTFPFEFYELIYGLQGWGKPRPDHKFHQAVGRLTLDLVYSRLAPGVRDEVLRRTPRYPSGELKYRLHQWFTPGFGHPKLREHIAAVMALMRAARTWPQFENSINRALPKFTEDVGQIRLELEACTERDQGVLQFQRPDKS